MLFLATSLLEDAIDEGVQSSSLGDSRFDKGVRLGGLEVDICPM